jgi:hypothetical protein
MYVHVSREEWLFRGLAIATILALVGMAVMPVITSSEIYAGLKYAGVIKGNKYADAFFLIGGGLGFTGRIAGQLAAKFGWQMAARISAALVTGPVGWAITAWLAAGL